MNSLLLTVRYSYLIYTVFKLSLIVKLISQRHWSSKVHFSNSQTHRLSAHRVSWNAEMTLRLIRSTNWRNHSLLSLKKLECTTSRRSMPRNGRKHRRLRPLAFLFTGTWVTQMARRRHSLWQPFTALRLRHQQWIGYQQPCYLSRLSLQRPWAGEPITYV